MKNNTIKLLDFGLNKKGLKPFILCFGINKNKKSIPIKVNLFSKILNKIKYQKIFGKKLQKNTAHDIDFLVNIKSYKGIRHKLKYPARGQRTHTNAKTKKKFTYKRF